MSVADTAQRDWRCISAAIAWIDTSQASRVRGTMLEPFLAIVLRIWERERGTRESGPNEVRNHHTSSEASTQSEKKGVDRLPKSFGNGSMLQREALSAQLSGPHAASCARRLAVGRVAYPLHHATPFGLPTAKAFP